LDLNSLARSGSQVFLAHANGTHNLINGSSSDITSLAFARALWYTHLWILSLLPPAFGLSRPLIPIIIDMKRCLIILLIIFLIWVYRKIKSNDTILLLVALSMIIIVNYITIPTYGKLMQQPIKEAGLLAKNRGYKDIISYFATERDKKIGIVAADKILDFFLQTMFLGKLLFEHRIYSFLNDFALCLIPR